MADPLNTPTELRAYIKAVQTARRRGLRSVTFGDRTDVYTSDSEMRQVETDLKSELRAAVGQRRQFHLMAVKGLR